MTNDLRKETLYRWARNNRPDCLAKLDAFDWNSWLYAPGMPPIKMPFNRSLEERAQNLAFQWDQARNNNVEANMTAFAQNQDIMTSFFPDQKVAFLERIQECSPLPAAQLDVMDQLYKFSCAGNSEIKYGCGW